MSRPFEIYIFIVNYNSAELLRECLAPLEGHRKARIFVVDNYHSEVARANVRAVVDDFSDVKLFENATNVGFGAALNDVVSQVAPEKGDVLWFLNPDTVVEQGCIEALLDTVVTGQYDIVSPVISTGLGESTRIWFAGGDIDTRRWRTTHWGFGHAPHRLVETRDCTFITGAAMMVSFEAWQRIGGFNRTLFLYWEDAEFCLRARELGMKLGVVGKARVWHAVGGTGEKRGKSAAYYYYMQRNRLWLAGRSDSASKMVFTTGLMETLKFLVRPLKEEAGRIDKTWNSVRGISDGLRGQFLNEAR
ncbi:glycosyltransferase family 2 protein [Arthrobacter sp. AOP36-A1-22]|uniref:glycosyltransferase family 2 protein n=1 Tax=Arthrobacter sp. AOP36-A1-22 TaxID=3457684 RepID=UPI0040336559